MANVLVKSRGLSHIFGGDIQVRLNVRDLSEIIQELGRRYPKFRRLMSSGSTGLEYIFLLNDKVILNEKSVLHDGDEVTILPVIEGGAGSGVQVNISGNLDFTTSLS